MNKDALVDRMVKLTGYPKNTCKECLDSFITAVSNAMKQDEQVVLTGFGTFLSTKRAARTGVNPATGKSMRIAARRVPKFRAGKALKDMVK